MGEGEKDKPAAKSAEASMKEETKPTESFWLVIIRDESEKAPQCVRCENSEALTRAIAEHVLSAPTPLYAFAFEGRRLDISSPRPVCSIKVGDKKIDVGRDGDEYDEGGRIVPLSKPEAPG